VRSSDDNDRARGEASTSSLSSAPSSEPFEDLVLDHRQHLGDEVTNTSPDRTNLVIPNSGPDTALLLKAGTVDYGWEYSSVSIQNGLPYITLPETIDLCSAQLSVAFKAAQVRWLSGATPVTGGGDTPSSRTPLFRQAPAMHQPGSQLPGFS
jgi:hypothetical protein